MSSRKGQAFLGTFGRCRMEIQRASSHPVDLRENSEELPLAS